MVLERERERERGGGREREDTSFLFMMIQPKNFDYYVLHTKLMYNGWGLKKLSRDG